MVVKSLVLLAQVWCFQECFCHDSSLPELGIRQSILCSVDTKQERFFDKQAKEKVEEIQGDE